MAGKRDLTVQQEKADLLAKGWEFVPTDKLAYPADFPAADAIVKGDEAAGKKFTIALLPLTDKLSYEDILSYLKDTRTGQRIVRKQGKGSTKGALAYLCARQLRTDARNDVRGDITAEITLGTDLNRKLKSGKLSDDQAAQIKAILDSV